MKRIIILYLVLSPLFTSSALAQEQRVYNQFFMNPFIYNPAYAGVEGHTVFYLLYRNQWPGIDETPQVNNFNFHTPLRGGIGLGFEFLNDTKADILKTNEAKVSASYLATFDNKHYLRFGLSIGAGSSGLDLSKASRLDISDQTLLTNTVDQSTYLLGSFGATYHTGHFNIGLSLPSIINSAPVTFDAFQSPDISPLDNMLIKVNYRGHINDNIAIEPHIIYRYNNYGTSQAEFTTILHILHIVWTGASYAQDAGLTAYAGVKIKDKFAVGAAFSPGKQSLSDITGNVLEIKMGYHLGGRKKHAQHVSSFIKSHRKTLEERQAEAEKKEQERLLALQKEEEADEEKRKEIERRKQEIEQRAADRLAADQALDEPEEEEEEEEIQAPVEKAIAEIKPIEETAEEAADSEEGFEAPVAEKAADSEEEFEAPVAEKEPVQTIAEIKEEIQASKEQPTNEELAGSKTPLRVKRGNHMLELPNGNYVIAGAFEIFENAERLSDKLFLKGYHNSKIGFVSARGYYYVVVDAFPTVREANRTRNRLQPIKGFEKNWVLIVE